jgi:signal transduction histidine kinase
VHDQARLIDDLIEVARAGRKSIPLEKTHLDLRTLIDHVLTDVRPTLAHNVTVQWSNDGSPLMLDADEGQLRRALRHLIDNAAKFMPSGGAVSIHVRAADGHAFVDVADEGIGLTVDELGRTFELFWRARHQVRGGGLGLGVVQSVVERHGGVVSARSAGTNQGATFTLSLPLDG